MHSYIYPRYLLEKNNVNKGDYVQQFSVNPPNALFTVFYGKSDAAGIGDKVLSLGMVKKQIQIDKLKVLVKGEQLPHLPWAVNLEMSQKLKNQITKILSTMHETKKGKRILAAAKLEQLDIAVDSDYDEHRKIVKAVLGQSY